MEHQHQNSVHGMLLGAPLFEDNALIALGTHYQQIMNPAGPAPMSWSTTDPTVLLSDHSWRYRAAPRAPVFSSDMTNNLLHQGTQVVDGYNPLQSSSDLADPFSDPICELSHWLQFYSLANQDQHNAHPCTPPFLPQAMSAQPTTCLQEAKSSGSGNMARENWRVEPDMPPLADCAPEVYKANPDFSPEESSSVVSDGGVLRDYNVHSHRLDGMQHENLIPLPDSWIVHNQAEGDDATLQFGGHTVLKQLNPFDMLPWSKTSAVPPFRSNRSFSSLNDRERAFWPALDDPLQFLLTTDMTRRVEFPLNHVSSAELAYKEVPGRPLAWQGMSGAYDPVEPAKRPGKLAADQGKSNSKMTVTSVEPQSVAARHRRKKISERIRVLEKLIPGGNKMDTATMLDEAIEYVKFLQLQVQLLEALGDMAESTRPVSLTPSPALAKGIKRKAPNAGGDVDQSCSAALPVISVATSPLILSEVIQQQLFRKKLCLVSVRQCPPRSVPSSRDVFAEFCHGLSI
ncbi:hypothetical protein CY35_18G063700 [Sphagnum magellanicum]|nr:hypothetical protein CY35_18G063700 [Sphagnum magellanicum]